jgi:hypothetical protein
LYFRRKLISIFILILLKYGSRNPANRQYQVTTPKYFFMPYEFA